MRRLTIEWYARVSVIEEAHDLKKYRFDELIEALLTHKMSLSKYDEDSKKNKKKDKKPRTMVLKDDSSDDSDEGEDMVLLTYKFKRFLKKDRKYPKKYPKKSFIMNKKNSEDKHMKDLNKDIKYFECGEKGHI